MDSGFGLVEWADTLAKGYRARHSQVRVQLHEGQGSPGSLDWVVRRLDSAGSLSQLSSFLPQLQGLNRSTSEEYDSSNSIIGGSIPVVVPYEAPLPVDVHHVVGAPSTTVLTPPSLNPTTVATDSAVVAAESHSSSMSSSSDTHGQHHHHHHHLHQHHHHHHHQPHHHHHHQHTGIQTINVNVNPVDLSAPMGKLGMNLDELLFAFDFDQTITQVKVLGGRRQTLLRGGESTREMLNNLHRHGAHLAIVTATTPSVENAKSIAKQVRDLGLERMFDVDEFDPAPIKNLLKSWGRNEDLSIEKLMKKLITLLVLLTDRWPADLERIGFSPIKIDDAKTKVRYRLIQTSGPSKGDWSAEQSLSANREDPLLCPVQCWAHLIERTAEFRRTKFGEKPPDRFFLRFHQLDDAADTTTNVNENENENASVSTSVSIVTETFGSLGVDSRELTDDAACMKAHEIIALLEDVLREAGLDPTKGKVRELFEEPAKVVELSGGIKIVEYGTIICARYNKAEAVQHLASNLPSVKTIIFVDDNSDNVFNVFNYFYSKATAAAAAAGGSIGMSGTTDAASATSALTGSSSSSSSAAAVVSGRHKIISCWYPPPEGGVEENVDPDVQKLIQLLANM
jgi:hypothetical protein